MISFGLVNQEAQAKAKIGDGNFTYFSNKNNVFSEKTDDTIYATLEENFTRVDGTMFFLPRRNTSDTYYDTGLISENLVSNAQYELTINLNIAATDFKGITINFGENYPVDFDMVSSSGQVIEFRGNTESLFSTEEVLVNTTFVKLVFYTMKNRNSRLRIYSIRFGYGLVYYNDSVLSSSLESYISPIGSDVPQIDFSVQLKNYDHYFNVDNPKSAINFLETGQEMEIYYGYQLPNSDEIEWIKGNQLLCSEWESDDYTATIRCQDIFRNMDSEYYKGLYSPGGKSYYALAEEVLQDAGLSEYYIDPRLKSLFTKNPIPRVQHKEALQIIANACRCVLSQTRSGTTQIKSNFVPEVSVASNGETSYSSVGNILTNLNKDEYATFGTNYTTVDGGMFFLPRNLQSGINTGYISAEQSNNACQFTNNPILTVTQEIACKYYGFKIVFGHSLPSEFIVRTYNNGELVNEHTIVSSEIKKTTSIFYDFDDFDVMKIEFTNTQYPNNRIIVNHFSFGDITDFTMTRQDMTTSPKAIKQELIREVIVPSYSYQAGASEENLISEDVEVISGQIETYYIGEPSYNYRVLLNNSTNGVSIVSWGNYYITVQYHITGTFQLDVLGYTYKIVEQYARTTLNARGKTIKWENPLISDMAMANDLTEWLCDYYNSGIEYEYNTRGNPEIDVNDIVYQENEFNNGMKVNIYRQTLNFAGAFSGKVTARRIGG
ncbi:MAG: hypothetical protein ACK5L6_13525 [Anaerorhabdus sp.]|uniref:hypothetical protein n=1 Tax=Anaerorhabdus sp. TaxID=1872524 RepID=UPI003A867F8A